MTNKLEATYKELLKKFVSTSWGLERLLLVDEEMITAIVAWPHVGKKLRKSCRSDDDSENPWSYIEWDLEEWSELSQMQVNRLRKTASRLVKLKLIYPDGSLPNEVAAMIRTRITSKMPIKLVPKKLGPKEMTDD